MKKLILFLLVTATVFGLIPSAVAASVTNADVWDGTLPSVGQSDTLDTLFDTNGTSYLLQSAADVAALAAFVNAGNGNETEDRSFTLCCDMDIDNKAWQGIGRVTSTTADKSTAFQGTFDGNGHVIQNLGLADTAADDLSRGFFGYIANGATVKNLGIIGGNASVTAQIGEDRVGALVGTMGGGCSLQNCFNMATLAVSTYKNIGIGGLVGQLNGKVSTATAVITDCINTGDIRITACKSGSYNVRMGGIVGDVLVAAKITDSGNYGAIVDTVGAQANNSYGQLAGQISVGQSIFITATEVRLGGSIAVKRTDSRCGTVFGYINGSQLEINSIYHTSNVTLNGSTATVPYIGATDPESVPQYTKQNYIAEESIPLVATGIVSSGFAQNHKDGHKARFGAELVFDTGLFEKTGVSITFGGKTVDLGGTVVYSSLSATVQGVNTALYPQNGKTFIAYGISDIPDELLGTLTATPYAVMKNGTTVWGKTGSFNLSRGTLSAMQPPSQSGTVTTTLYWDTSYDGGAYTNYRLPSIVVTKQDTVIVYGEARNTESNSDGGNQDECLMDLYLRRSTDGGVSFSDPIYIAKGAEYLAAGLGETLNNPCMTVGNDGKLHLLFCSDVGKKGVFYTSSVDDGITWSTPVNIASQLTGVSYQMIAFGPGHGVCLESGRMVVSAWLYYNSAFHVYPVYSDDGGSTWQLGEAVSNNRDETCIAKTSDGGVLFNSRQYTTPNESTPYRVLSASETGIDGWTASKQHTTLIDPACCGGMTSVELENKPHAILFSNNASTEKRNNLTVRCSLDDGATWSQSIVIDKENGGYSDIAVDSKGKVYVIYEQAMGTRVMLATFDLEEVFDIGSAT